MNGLLGTHSGHRPGEVDVPGSRRNARGSDRSRWADSDEQRSQPQLRLHNSGRPDAASDTALRSIDVSRAHPITTVPMAMRRSSLSFPSMGVQRWHGEGRESGSGSCRAPQRPRRALHPAGAARRRKETPGEEALLTSHARLHHRSANYYGGLLAQQHRVRRLSGGRRLQAAAHYNVRREQNGLVSRSWGHDQRRPGLHPQSLCGVSAGHLRQAPGTQTAQVASSRAAAWVRWRSVRNVVHHYFRVPYRFPSGQRYLCRVIRSRIDANRIFPRRHARSPQVAKRRHGVFRRGIGAPLWSGPLVPDRFMRLI